MFEVLADRVPVEFRRESIQLWEFTNSCDVLSDEERPRRDGVAVSVGLSSVLDLH